MEGYLVSTRKQFTYYKSLGDSTLIQLTQEQLHFKVSSSSNSIAVIIQHLVGNMLSRWTDFLTSDGEKEWRNRDQEFNDLVHTKEDLIANWEQGWACLFRALDELSESDLNRIIYIRNMGHTVMEAINRQLAHYPYHIGQVVFIGKMIQNENWQSLSIPKGNSSDYNKEKFAKPQRREHFTDDL